MTLVLIARHMTRNKLIQSAMYHCQNPFKLNQFLGISNYGISDKKVTKSRKRYAKMTYVKKDNLEYLEASSQHTS
jgi:hypothetical protein